MSSTRQSFKLLVSAANYLPGEFGPRLLPERKNVKIGQVIEEIRKDGFGLELWMNWPDKSVFDRKNWDKIKQQVSGINDITIHSECVNKDWESVKKEIELAAYLNVRALVVHPLNFGVVEAEDKLEIDKDYLGRVLCKAEEDNVILALENGSFDTLQKFCGLSGNSDNMKICVDIGHANIHGQFFLPEDCLDPVGVFIREFKDKIVHFHLHDNFGRKDEHLIPGKGSINWDKVIGHMRSLNQEFTETLELRGNISNARIAALQAKGFLNSFSLLSN